MCTLCARGAYQQLPKQATCPVCPAGMDAIPRIPCLLPCISNCNFTGRFSNSTGSSVCFACPAGRSVQAGRSACQLCSPGAAHRCELPFQSVLTCSADECRLDCPCDRFFCLHALRQRQAGARHWLHRLCLVVRAVGVGSSACLRCSLTANSCVLQCSRPVRPGPRSGAVPGLRRWSLRRGRRRALHLVPDR